jgi:hypothetical protein
MQKAKGYALLKRDFPQGFVQALCPRSFLKDLSLSTIKRAGQLQGFCFSKGGTLPQVLLRDIPASV